MSGHLRVLLRVVYSFVVLGVFMACAGRNRAAPPQLGAPAVDAGIDGVVSTNADARGPDGPSHLEGKMISPLPCGTTAFSTAVQRAMPPLRSFPKASPDDAAEAAAQLLVALADAIDSLPGSGAAEVRKDVEEIRFEAKRLQRSNRFSFVVPRWIKLGVAAAADALDRLTSAHHASRYWVEAAKQAGDAIDPNQSLVFQRAVLQDSMRVLVDGFIVVGQCSSICK